MHKANLPRFELFNDWAIQPNPKVKHRRFSPPAKQPLPKPKSPSFFGRIGAQLSKLVKATSEALIENIRTHLIHWVGGVLGTALAGAAVTYHSAVYVPPPAPPAKTAETHSWKPKVILELD